MADSEHLREILKDRYILATKYPDGDDFFLRSTRAHHRLDSVIESACARVRRSLQGERYDPSLIRAHTAELRRRLKQAGPDTFVEIPWPAEYLEAQYGDRRRIEVAVVVTLTPKHWKRRGL